MTDREFKLIIDELWLAFASSGISNPISVIEQMTYLIFFKMFLVLPFSRTEKLIFSSSNIMNASKHIIN